MMAKKKHDSIRRAVASNKIMQPLSLTESLEVWARLSSKTRNWILRCEQYVYTPCTAEVRAQLDAEDLVALASPGAPSATPNTRGLSIRDHWAAECRRLAGVNPATKKKAKNEA